MTIAAGALRHKPTLKGERVVLRPFTASDIEAMGPILADPDVLRLTGSVHSSAEAESASPVLDEKTRRWYESRHEQDDRLDLAVIDRTGIDRAATYAGECVGEIVLNDCDEANGSCNFRVLMGPRGRDRGLGSEATQLLVDYAFGELELNRIELEVFAFNPRAQRVYEKAGFVVEGVRREAFVFDGERSDAIVMAQLRSEWIERMQHER